MTSLKDIRIWVALVSLVLAVQAMAQQESPAGELREGHWVEARGTFGADGVFLAQRVYLVQPERYETLVGTVDSIEDADHFTLLGQRVELQAKTTFTRIGREELAGARVKVDGYFRSHRKFSARKVYPRSAGLDRITGRIAATGRGRDGLELEMMTYRVLLPEDLMVRHELAFDDYEITDPRAQSIVDRNRDEDDLFGKGIRISDNLQLAGQMTARGRMEDEFDLNERNARNREDLESTLRLRMVYQATSSLFAVAEISHRQQLRDDERSGRLHDDVTRAGETYLYWLDPFGNGLDLQAGRVDFDDEREWLYDQNLDAVRAIWTGERIRAEMSYSEVLGGGSPLNEAAQNSILYVSNNDRDRTLAGYVIHREFDLPVPVRRTHYGLRFLGEWFPDHESWLEIAFMNGRTGLADNRGWAFDAGTTWEFHERFSLTAGYAVGQGDDPDSATDNTFRQTGLEDNNGKLAGVTSFRYYGELLDPELANLEILTAGLGWLPRKGVSIDLVGHSYRQNQLSRRQVDIEIGKRPNGLNSDLGWEVDLVLGWRTSSKWDLEAIAAWFKPGKAFDNADNAFLGKLQIRYRF